MLIVSATSIYFLLYKYEFLTTLSSSNNSDGQTNQWKFKMCWCICPVASFVRGSRQLLQGGRGGGPARDDFVFQSGPRSVSEIKQCEFIKFEFS